MNRILLFNKRHPFIFPLIAAALFVCCVYLLAPLNRSFEFDPDEGTDAMKSVLLIKGYPLYGAIWSDQPPMFTVIIAAWFHVFGTGIVQARLLVLLFSALLLFSLYGILATVSGWACALLACVLLVFSFMFMQLSVALMIGIPAFSLAMASLLCWFRYKKHGDIRLLLLSAALMALSLLIKLLAPFLIPIFLLELVSHDRAAAGPGFRYKNTLLWLACCSLVYCSIMVVFFHPYPHLFYQQIIQPHLKQLAVPGCDFGKMIKALLQDIDLVLLVIIGIPLLAKRWKTTRVPALWLCAATVILLVHRPIWHHYYLFLSIPLSWLAAESVCALGDCAFKPSPASRTRRIVVLLILLPALLFLMITKPAKTRSGMVRKDIPAERDALNILRAFAPRARWMLTDRPMFGFRAGILSPPEAALLSHKRPLDARLADTVLRRYRPEIVLVSRPAISSPDIVPLCAGAYEEVFFRQVVKPANRPPFMLAWQSKTLGRVLPQSFWSKFLSYKQQRSMWTTRIKALWFQDAQKDKMKLSDETIIILVRKDLLQ